MFHVHCVSPPGLFLKSWFCMKSFTWFSLYFLNINSLSLSSDMMTPCWPFPGPQQHQQLRAFASAFGHPGLPGPDWRLMAGVRAHAAEQWALHARIFPSPTHPPSSASVATPASSSSNAVVNPSPAAASPATGSVSGPSTSMPTTL